MNKKITLLIFTILALNIISASNAFGSESDFIVYRDNLNGNQQPIASSNTGSGTLTEPSQINDPQNDNEIESGVSHISTIETSVGTDQLSSSSSSSTVGSSSDSYGVVIKVEASQEYILQLKIIQTVAKLLKNGIKLYWVSKDYSTSVIQNDYVPSGNIQLEYQSSNNDINLLTNDNNPTALESASSNNQLGGLSSTSSSSSLQPSSYVNTGNIQTQSQEMDSIADTTTTPSIPKISKGSYVIPFTGNSNKDQNILTIVNSYLESNSIQILTEPLEDINVLVLNSPKILSIDASISPGFSNGWDHDCQYFGFDYKEVHWNEIPTKLNNNDYNLFIWPGGDANLKNLINNQIDAKQFNTIRNFVGNGGGYVGSCYGGYEASNGYTIPFSILKPYFKNLPAMPFLSILDSQTFRALPGVGDFSVKIIDSDNPISFGLDEIVTHCDYAAGPMFINCGRKTDVVGVINGIDEENFWYGYGMPINWFLEYLNLSIPQLVLKTWAKASIGKAIWVTSKFGSGRVVAFGDHPECNFYYSEWKDEYTFFMTPRASANALLYATSRGPIKIDLTTTCSSNNSDSSSSASSDSSTIQYYQDQCVE